MPRPRRRHLEPHLGAAAGRDSTASSAPTSSARSRMPRRPPSSGGCSAKPRPSSRPSSTTAPPRARAQTSTVSRAGVAQRRWSAPPGRRGRSRARPRAPSAGSSRSKLRARPRRPSCWHDSRAERDQRADQAEVVERLGPQLARDPAHVLEAARAGRASALERRAACGRLGRRRDALELQQRRAVRVWPTSSCSSRATRSRSASCAASARRARRAARSPAGRASR